MKILKPNWVSHDGHPIYSVDIHPDGSRFATGGQGEDSGRIVIWNMAPVTSRDNEKNENIPKMLCQMDNHLACVNCVRWSASGKFLASGGDDRLIMIWKITYYQAGSVVFGSSGGKGNVETWRCSSTLSGHTGDVLDLAWSPQDTWLASCSVDNNVIIWNALKMPEIVAILKGHTGLVKGVVWDPVGKYIASQSDDKTLRIWRTADWKQDAVIQEPFEECGGTTYVLRLNWSPDGLYLVSAHAMNGGGPTALIIEREGWQQDKDFVGHRKAVTCVRFNSNILQKSFVSSSKPQLYCCCAIGSRDRSVSVWLTALKRPRVVIRDLFTNSVLDLSWSTSGLQLMACSWDGTVAYVEFTTDELGKCLTLEEKNAIHERMYGKSLAASTCQTNIVENPELLGCGFKSDSGNTGSVANHVDEEKPVIPQTPMKGPINKQIETRTSDGKRRITPMYIPPAPSGDVPVPFGSAGSQPTFSSSTEPKSRILIEKRDDIVVPNVSQSSNKALRLYQSRDVKVTSQERQVGNVQKSFNTSVASEPANQHLERNSHEEDCRFPFSKQICSPVAIENLQVAVSQNVRTAKEQEKVTLSRANIGQQMNIDIAGFSQHVQVSNSSYSCKYGPLTTVRLFKKNVKEPLWTIVLGSTALAAAANRRTVVVACEDNSLHVLNTSTGCRAYPTIVMASSPSQLVLNKQHVGVLTSCGQVSVWNLLQGKVIARNESVLPLMRTETDTIVKFSVTDDGVPLLALSCGKAFVFSLELGSWLLVGNKHDPVQCLSYHSSFTKPTQDVQQWPLASMQVHTQISSPASLSSARLFCGPAPSLCTLAHLEHQLAACQALKSEREYQFWFSTLVRFLVHEGLQYKLRCICDDLLGPSHASTSWESHIMGRHKHAILRDVLDTMKQNLSLQRLYSEYSDQLLHRMK